MNKKRESINNLLQFKNLFFYIFKIYINFIKMSSENFFYNNRFNKKSKILFFKSWISSVYFATLKSFLSGNVTIATKQYRMELTAAISLCQKEAEKKKLNKVLETFEDMSLVSKYIY